LLNKQTLASQILIIEMMLTTFRIRLSRIPTIIIKLCRISSRNHWNKTTM